MVTVKNVKIEGDIATCEYYQETDTEGGILKVNLSTGDIIENFYPKRSSGTYARMGALILCQMYATGEPLPEVLTNIWY